MPDFFPFDSGQGSNVTEAQWGLMAKNWLGTGVIKGVLNEFKVYADSTGMQCKVKSGNAWIQGFFFQVASGDTIVPISAANATNPRIDRVAIQVDWTNNNISLIAIQGTPASSPTPPALTQNTSIWQISLAQVYVGANVSTIAAGNITDERVFAGANAYFYTRGSSLGNYTTTNALQQLPITTGTTKLSGCTVGTNEINFLKGGKYLFLGIVGLSGLNNLISAECLIRCYQADLVTYSDDTFQIVGPSGVGGNTSPSFPILNTIVFDVPAGGKVQFFLRVGESPRTINQMWLIGFRIGD